MTIISSRTHIYFKTSFCILVSEYLLGDLAFECFPFVIGAYKQAGGQAIDYEGQILNDALTTSQVLSEHTIGMWKGRFP